jgi:NifU-like protein
MYCSVMGYEALRLAIARYRGEAEPDVAMQTASLCKCFGVGEPLIARTIRTNKLTDPEQVTAHTKAGGGCASCFKQVETVLARVNAEMVAAGELAAELAYRPGSAAPQIHELKPRGESQLAINALKAVSGGPPAHLRAGAPPAAPAPVRDSEIARRFPEIDAAVESLRPRIQRDGGDCELVNVEGNTVYLKLSGNCVGCQLASVTLSGLQGHLIEKLGRPMRVVPVESAHS